MVVSNDRTPPGQGEQVRRPRATATKGRRASTWLLWFELSEMRGPVAIVVVAIAAVALGLATVWPALAWAEAIAAMLLLPPAIVAVALHRSFFSGPGLRAAAWVVGVGSALLAFGAATVTLFPGEPIGSVWVGGDVPERTVVLPAATHITLAVSAPARSDGRPLRLGVGRGDQEHIVGLSFDSSAEDESSVMGLGEPTLTRRAAVAVPGEGPLRIRLVESADSESPRVHVVVRAAGIVDRSTLPAVGALGVVGLVTQWVAGRRRARSWLLLGSWTALAFAVQAPTAWDANQPGWTAAGILLFSVLAGGGLATIVSYLIAKAYESRPLADHAAGA